MTHEVRGESVASIPFVRIAGQPEYLVLFGHVKKTMICSSKYLSIRSANAIQANPWSLPPSVLAVPKVNALNPAPFAWQVDDAGLATIRNTTAYLKLFLCPISVAHEDAVEIHRATGNTQLDRPKRSSGGTYTNAILIPGSIHTSVSKMKHLCALGARSALGI